MNNKKDHKEENEEFLDDQPDQEESIMYTDENIDEVLGKDEEVETLIDDEPSFEEEAIKKGLEIFTPKEIPEMVPLKPEISEKPISVGNYENVFITNQVHKFFMQHFNNFSYTL